MTSEYQKWLATKVVPETPRYTIDWRRFIPLTRDELRGSARIAARVAVGARAAAHPDEYPKAIILR